MIRGSDSSFTIRRLTQESLHVGLTSDQPDLAHENVLQLDRVFAGDGHDLRRGAGPERLKVDAPFPFTVSSGVLLLLRETYSDRLARIRFAPNRDHAIALQHHAAPNHVRQSYVRARRGARYD
jgi:hypothetical protein